MIAYASRTGTKRNLAVLREAGWHLLVSRAGVWRTEGFPYALDNGAWSDYQQGREFDAEAFREFVTRFAAGAELIVVPDVVAKARASLALTEEWLPQLERFGVPLLIAVQDGMTDGDIRDWLGPRVGIFVGGTTDWKLDTMHQWGCVARRHGAWLHIGRVNSRRRIIRSALVGADSFDGSGVSRYGPHKLELLDAEVRQPVLFNVERGMNKAEREG